MPGARQRATDDADVGTASQKGMAPESEANAVPVSRETLPHRVERGGV